MDWFSPAQFARINDALFEIHSATDLGGVISALMTHLSSLVPASNSAGFHVGDDGREFTEVISPDLSPKLFDAYKDYYEQFDVYKDLVFGRAPIPPVDRSSDYIDYREWERSPHRSEFLIPNGLYHLAGIQVTAGEQLVGDVCVHRAAGERDFSQTDMAILRMLQLHTSLAARNCLLYASSADRLATAVQAERYGVVVFDSALRPAYRNATAELIFGQYQQYAGHGVRLLDLLTDLLAHQRALPADASNAIAAPSWSGTLDAAHRALKYTVVTTASSAGARYLVYLEWEDIEGYPGQSPELPCGLSSREYEIARLVARGMSNPTIAVTLCISLETVKTHVKHILEKTGSRNRTQAAHTLFGDHSQLATDGTQEE